MRILLTPMTILSRALAFLLLSAPIATAPALAQTVDSAAIARARADSLRHPWTEADARFMTGMIPHHAQAIRMAKWAAPNGASREVQTLAGRIINAQRDDIALMQRWLLNRGQPVPAADTSGPGMTMDAREHHHLMPGMLTEDQMQRLEAARGEAFDRLFLELMIQHHRGATQMVKALFDQDGTGLDQTVFKLASDINVDQTTEIARMQRMLAARLAAKPAP